MKKRKFVLFTGVSLLLFCSSANLISCTKTNTKTVTVVDTTILTVHDTVVRAQPPSIMSFLTGKQWQYDTVLLNYTGAGTGSVEYIRGASGNPANFDNFFSTFTVQGDLWFNQNANYYLSQWSFLNNDSVTIKMVSSTFGTSYFQVLKLNATSLTLYDSVDKVLDVEGVAP